MVQTSVVQVSGRGTNVDFTIDDTSPFDQVVSSLRKYLEENRSLWSKGNITVNAGLRMGSREQLTELKRLIEKESGLTVARFWCSSDTVDPASAGTSSREDQRRVQPPSRPLPESTVHQAKSPVVVKPIPPVGDPPKDYAPTRPTLAAAPPVVPAQSNSRPKPRIEPRTVAPSVNLDVGEETAAATQVHSAPGPEADPRQARPRLQAQSRLDERPKDSAQLESDGTAFDFQGKNQFEYQAEYMESRRDTALFVKSTCRSGEIIRYSGDVVVLGDVNPGAEIVAGGDITVFGALRGVAHAGSNGLTKAAIIAYKLESPRLQIGPYIGLTSNVGPSGGKRSESGGSGPMIAFVRRRSIYVAEFAGRFSRYSRGILYEG